MTVESRKEFAQLLHKKPKGTLIIIGGREDKEADCDILKEVVRRVGRGQLVIATVASSVPEELASEYRKVFRQLGLNAKQLHVFDARTREDAYKEEYIDLIQK